MNLGQVVYEHGKLRSVIGIIWNVKKNKEEMANICKQYSIDYKKNKIILRRISIQELQSKIESLKAHNMSLVAADGLLIDIFSMSSPNMQEKLGERFVYIIGNDMRYLEEILD